MKKTNYILWIAGAVMMLSAVSCARPEMDAPETVKPSAGMTFRLGIPEVKTSLGPSEDGRRKVYWSNGDQVSINGVESVALADLPENSAQATFSLPDGATAPSSPYSIIYPSSIYKDATTVTLPAVQSFKSGTFDDGMFPMAGYSEEGFDAGMKYLCATLKISVKLASGDNPDTDKITLVTFKGKGGEQVSGDFTVNYENATLTGTSRADAADKSVCVSLNQALSSTTALDIFVVVPAGTYSGFTVTVQDAKGHTMEKNLNHNQELVAGKLYNLPEFAFVPTGEATGIEIWNAQDLIAFATAYNAKEYENYPGGLIATVMKNIDFDENTSAAFNATGGIGCVIGNGTNYFNGIFEGGNHTISGYSGSVPIFAYSGSGGTIRNLVIADDCDKTVDANNENDLFGAFVGYHKGLLQNCISHADLTFSNITVKGHYYGGLVGRNHGGRVIGCTMDGDIICPAVVSISTAAHQAGIGGIAGRSNGEDSVIDDCHFKGNITVNNGSDYGGITGVKGVNFLIGGIVGHHQEGTISNCDTMTGMTIDFRGTFNAYAGGIVGWVEEKDNLLAKIEYCTNNMALTYASNGGRSVITPTAIGGVVGHGFGASFIGCINNGAVNSNCNANLLYMGGIAAMGDDSSFSGCLNTGNLTHTNQVLTAQAARYITMGGIVGVFSESATKASTVSSCKNSGKVLCNQLGTSTATTVDMGGVVGKTDGPSLTISQCKNLTNGIVQVIDINNKVAFPRTALGGIIGYAPIANTIIRECYNSAKIHCQYSQGATDNRPTYIGGIAGRMGTNDGLAGLEIDDCHSTGCVQNQNYNNTVTLEGGPIHGGIVGAILGTEASKAFVHDCTSASPSLDSLITGQRGICGGIVGYASNATLEDNNSSAYISMNSNAVGCGGIAGWTISTSLSNCTYSGLVGATTGTNVAPKNVGGFIYLMDGNSSITGCNVNGATLTKGTHASATAAAVLVSNAASGATITNCGVKGTLDGAAITLSSNMITTDGGATVTGTYLLD